MKANRKLLAALAGAVLAPVLVLVSPAGIASAHGYVNSPASRQAQCAQHTVSCGEITYEPQSVEGPKGLHSCNGGLAQFAELNDDSKGWQAGSVGTTATFNWIALSVSAGLALEVTEMVVCSFTESANGTEMEGLVWLSPP